MQSEFSPGDSVLIGDNIEGVIEEMIIARGMSTFLLLVDYWHDGQLVSRRFHAEDCRKVGGQ